MDTQQPVKIDIKNYSSTAPVSIYLKYENGFRQYYNDKNELIFDTRNVTINVLERIFELEKMYNGA